MFHGIPYADYSVDVVYHSHVLEHMPRQFAPVFIQECFRVLKIGGIIRVAVPDLERIVREYLKNLEQALNDDEQAANRLYNYFIAKQEIEQGSALTYKYDVQFIDDSGDLDMALILMKFQELMKVEMPMKNL
ncbi:MAG: hypothetical protein OMM_09304 [Candidatus Magnetoglobus multicellularis str. Araruama]|uniref:Methyltransferase type 11 domain-containing protein n=1 Tax=Candidatus Magnetoglobus multicellularis str. Araruama TaxID=890399 RepID=A0A1V1P4X8_9BACT|nr:MAG: hypothetical protein OMM_09304 [Candidatus Magnetoglobus multicellularis str. Araruama]